MIEIIPSSFQITRAQKLAKDMGVLKNSIKKGRGNVAGFLGEILFADYFGYALSNTYEYDIVTEYGTIDVKTKLCTSKPQEEYYCSIAAYNTSQECDFYVFVRLLKNFSIAWLVGFISKGDFFERAKFSKLGELDPSSPSHIKFHFKADCYNLPIKKLNSFKDQL